MWKHLLLPGSFDPVTVGHLDIIARAVELAETVEVVVFVNPAKPGCFTLPQRVRFLRLATAQFPTVRIGSSEGYVADYVREVGADAILKGFRNGADADYELPMAHYNRLHGGVETFLLPCDPQTADISSSRVRQALAAGEPLDGLLPAAITEAVQKAWEKRAKTVQRP